MCHYVTQVTLSRKGLLHEAAILFSLEELQEQCYLGASLMIQHNSIQRSGLEPWGMTTT